MQLRLSIVQHYFIGNNAANLIHTALCSPGGLSIVTRISDRVNLNTMFR